MSSWVILAARMEGKFKIIFNYLGILFNYQGITIHGDLELDGG